MLRHGASVNVRNRQGHAALESLLFSFRRVNTSFCLPFLLDNHAKMNVECYAAIMSKDKYRSAYIKWKASWQYRRQYISFVSGVQPGTCRALLENDDKHICRYLCDGNIIRSICLYLGPWPSGLVWITKRAFSFFIFEHIFVLMKIVKCYRSL